MIENVHWYSILLLQQFLHKSIASVLQYNSKRILHLHLSLFFVGTDSGLAMPSFDDMDDMPPSTSSADNIPAEPVSGELLHRIPEADLLLS